MLLTYIVTLYHNTCSECTRDVVIAMIFAIKLSRDNLILNLPFTHCTSSVSGTHSPFPMQTLTFGPVRICPKGQLKMAVVPSVIGSVMPMTLIELASKLSDDRGWLHGLPATCIIMMHNNNNRKFIAFVATLILIYTCRYVYF